MDTGTKKIVVHIDGKDAEAKHGWTILKAAKEAGIYIPTLCAHEDLSPYGACRLCVVSIEGMRGLPPSCLIEAKNGMKVTTNSPEIRAVRKNIAELLLADHPDDCLYCPKNLKCELQLIAEDLGVRERRLRRLTRKVPVDVSNPFFTRDMNKCVLCGRCVRTCEEIAGIHAIDLMNRGYSTVVSPFMTDEIAQSRCQSCGECVVRCPTGALSIKEEYKPQFEVRSVCPYCGVGCGLLLGVSGDRVISVHGDPDNVVNKGRLCVKGRFGTREFLSHEERLNTPLIREGDKFREASWDEALNLVAGKFSKYKGSFAALSSAKVTNEENYVFQKFVRAVMGTNNVDHCARLCHASTVAGLAASFGSGAMTNSMDEIANADCILITGTNTTENHPVLSLHVKQAKKNGAKIIVIDPRTIDLCEIADVSMRQKPGTDVAWINGMMNVIIAEGLYDRKYVQERTEGFQELKKTVEKYTPEYVEKITGIPADDLLNAARMFGGAERGSILYAMGITQHITGTDNVKSLANLSMLCGDVGIESGGVNPLRGQNNVQGACDMGGLPNVFPGYQPVTNHDALKKFEELWDAKLEDKVGLTIGEMLKGAHDGNIKAMYIMGENPMLSDPDLAHVEESLGALEFLVVQDIFMTETAKIADVVLPSAAFAEKDGTFTNTERRVQRVRKAVNPLGNVRQDWEIICDIASRMGYPMKYEEPSEIMDEIAKTTPQYGGVSFDRIEENGLQWPCPNKEHPGTKYLHKDKFTRGKGLFHAIEFKPPAEEADEEYPLIMTTGRILYQFHTGSMTRKSRGLETLGGEAFLEMNPKDAKALDVADGDKIRVSSRRGKVVVSARVTGKIMEGVVFMPFHFAEAAANRLTNPVSDPTAKIPEFKVCAVKVEKMESVKQAS